MSALSDRQAGVLREMQKDGPGWNRNQTIAWPTLEGLEKRGLIKIRNGPNASFYPERQVLVLDPENPDAALPAPTLREITATEFGRAWRLLGFDKYMWKGGDPEPECFQRLDAAAILRLLADKLEAPVE